MRTVQNLSCENDVVNELQRPEIRRTLPLVSAIYNHTEVCDSTALIIVHGFWPKSENFDFGQKGYHMKDHLKRNRMAQISAS